MENKEEVNPMSDAVKFGGGPEGFLVAARAIENPTSQIEAPTMAALQPVNLGVAAAPTSTLELKKKRGRPRKYGGPEGGTVTAALSPMPISASIPLSGGDFSGWKQLPPTKLKPFQALKKPHKLDFQALGNQHAFVVGANFTTHVITVDAGEDVAMKILSFSQQDSQAICVLSASGSISNVTLRQPNSSGGTLTYEGRFEILSLSGSFMQTDNGILKSRSGGMSVSLAGTDGRVLGGGLAGLLIAASPVQVVLGSFMVGHQAEPKLKKQRTEPHSVPAPTPINTFISPFNREHTDIGGGSYGGQNLSFSSPPSNHTDPMASLHSPQDSKDVETDNLTSSSPEEESNEDSPSRFEISG
ncbi:hypothetical protein V2J09_014517 [Rumex salicifolius]